MAAHPNPQTTAQRPYSDHPQAVQSRARRKYLREYQRAWVSQRRQAWIAANGPCAKCGSSDRLEVDHEDPSQKQINPRELWSMSPQNPRRIAELAKCQVLCFECHKEKTRLQLRQQALAQPHTNRTGFRGVTLEKCGRYRARGYRFGKPTTLGWFDLPAQAAKAVKDFYRRTA